MKTKAFLIFLCAGLAFGLASAWLASAAQVGATANGALMVYEMPLNPSGGAFEINLDPQGHLWVSDYTAGEIWELDPAGLVYTSYAGMGIPGDARPDGNGSVWYADGSAEILGQLSPISGTLTQWEAEGSDGLYATQIDNAGNVWATSFLNPLLYRFDLSSTEICSYTIPSTQPSRYIQTDGQSIWLGDYNGEYIFRLDPAQGEYTLWSLPVIGFPFGLDLDQGGNLWWADYYLGNLNRLEVGLDELTTFDLPYGSSPVMLDASTEQIKFTDDYSVTMGSLSPGLAISSTTTLITSTLPVEPICDPVEPLATTPVVTTTGVMTFTQNSYASLVDSGGWQIWQVPEDGAPYGVRVSGKSTWVADYWRNVLIWSFSGSVVSACKVADTDGNPGTTGDQTPLEGWRVYLKVDGVRQEPGELTSAAGCYAWLDLDSGHTYAVEEELPSGWKALTLAEKDFGQAAEGQLYSHTFVNSQELQQYIYLPLVSR